MHYPTNELLVAPHIYTVRMLPWQPSRHSRGNNLEDTHKCHCYIHKKYKQQNLSATAVESCHKYNLFDITCTYTVHISSSISQLEGKMYLESSQGASFSTMKKMRTHSVPWAPTDVDVFNNERRYRCSKGKSIDRTLYMKYSFASCQNYQSSSTVADLGRGGGGVRGVQMQWQLVMYFCVHT